MAMKDEGPIGPEGDLPAEVAAALAGVDRAIGRLVKLLATGDPATLAGALGVIERPGTATIPALASALRRATPDQGLIIIALLHVLEAPLGGPAGRALVEVVRRPRVPEMRTLAQMTISARKMAELKAAASATLPVADGPASPSRPGRPRRRPRATPADPA